MLVTEPICGLEFDIEKQNCYHALRAFFDLNYKIKLTDYPCPTDWWKEGGLDLYAALAEQEGFKAIHDHPTFWRPGDVLIMAIESTRGNHCAVLLPGNKIFHHLIGQRSLVCSYGGLFRNNLIAVYRHKDVPIDAPQTTDIKDLLSPHAQRTLAKRIGDRRAAASSDGGA